MFTVKVVNKRNGKNVSNKKVILKYSHVGLPCSEILYSNEKGEVVFNTIASTGDIYIDGIILYTGNFDGRRVIYV